MKQVLDSTLLVGSELCSSPHARLCNSVLQSGQNCKDYIMSYTRPKDIPWRGLFETCHRDHGLEVPEQVAWPMLCPIQEHFAEDARGPRPSARRHVGFIPLAPKSHCSIRLEDKG